MNLHSFNEYGGKESLRFNAGFIGGQGSVNFHLPSRSLNKNKPDGTSCHLKVHRTSDVLVSGAKQSIRGMISVELGFLYTAALVCISSTAFS